LSAVHGPAARKTRASAPARAVNSLSGAALALHLCFYGLPLAGRFFWLTALSLATVLQKKSQHGR
jgi:hypothetical protein